MNTLHMVVEKWSMTYGPLFTFKRHRGTVLVSADPEFNQQVLKQRPRKLAHYDRIESISKELHLYGVFSAEGAEWKRHRYVVMNWIR